MTTQELAMKWLNMMKNCDDYYYDDDVVVVD
jgi:hypothetical protein